MPIAALSSGRTSTRTSWLASLALVAAVLLVPTVAAPAQAAIDPCGPAGNKISCENSLPGSPRSEWDDYYGAGSETLQGFSTEISVNVGQRVDFKIDTNASAYTIDIYRTGYYNGDGARKVASVTPSVSLPQNQPNCISDVATQLYDCGNWAVSASWNVPATAVSGVYIARLHRADVDESSHITFIVRDDASQSDVVFQTADTTWQAYNTYGGSNFYWGGANGRAYKLSYNRPMLTRGGTGGRDFYFANEYPAVRFLEKNGYDVTYISGVDTHRRGNLLLNHETYLSVGHDEYWSGPQRANVEAARDAGVNLMFLSGNEMYWRVRYEPSADPSATPFRTLVSYKETWNNAKIDPSSEWTGTWRDPRYASPANGGGRPENAVTGTAYMVNDDDLAVTVSSEEGKLRLWRNTTLTSIPAGEKRALAPHTIGYESNEDLDNGHRPAGLVRLSTTTGPTPQYLQDFGNTVLPGTTTHHLTMYRAPSGARVFSAGSVQWTWGLDEVHDSPYAAEPADARMQQAQVNLLADMGAQPTTLQANLVAATASTDATGPTATITSPAAGSQQANGSQVTVTGTASDSGGGRVAGVEVSTDGGTSWHPATGTTSWTYTYVQHGQGTVPVKVRATDDSANIGAVTSRDLDVRCSCSVFGATVPPIAASDDGSAAELGLRFTPTVDGFASGVRFYKGAGNGGTHTGSLWSTSGQQLATVTFTNETATGWQSASFSQAVSLTAGTTYVVSYTAPQGRYAVQSEAFTAAGVQAPPLTVAGGWGATPAGVFANPGQYPANSHKNTNYFVDVMFTTVDESPLGVTNRSPLPGASSVPPGSNVEGRFSKAVVPGSQAITVTTGGQPVAGATSYDAGSRTITFDPTAPLAADTVYDVQVAGTDNLGNPVSAGGTWSFRSAKAPTTPGVCPCSLFEDTTTPTVLKADDNDAVTLGVRFAPTVDGKITSVRFYKGPDNTGTHTGTLWSANGTSLATGTFTGESSMGWQTLTFASPVEVTKNAEYVASYRTTVGKYSYTPGQFGSTDLSRGPLRVASDSGAYTYGTGFPGATVSTNYLVDVVFERNAAALTVAQRRPAADATNVARTTTVDLWVSAPLAAGATMQVTSNGQPVAGATSVGGGDQRVSFVPSQPLPADSLFSVSVTGLVSQEGASLPTQTWSFRTDPTADEGLADTIHGNVMPATENGDETDAIEVGTVFTPTVDGTVSAIRFFKGAQNTGTHVGTLWTAAGVPLGTVTFQNETPSGWQRAALPEPVPVTAGTAYVVSYYAPNGHYAATPGFFSEPRTSGALTTAAGAARFRYGTGGGFPTGSFGSPSYFVDVELGGSTPLAIAGRTPAPDATGVDAGTSVAVTFSEAIGTGHTLALSVGGTPVAGSQALSGDRRTLTFTPSAALPLDRDIQADLTGVVAQDDGQALGSRTWSFRTRAPAPMTLESRSPLAGETGVSRTTTVTATFSQPAASGWSLVVTGPSGAVAGAAVLSADGKTVTFTPSAQLAASTTFTVTLSGVVSTEGAALATTSWSFTTQAPPPITITSRNPAPGATNVDRSGPVTVTFSVPIANGYAMTPRVGTTAVAGTVSRSADQRTLTFTPTGLMPASSTVTVTLTGVVSTDGVALGTQSWSFTTAPRPTLTQTLFTGLTPAQTSTNTRAIEVGTHFTTSVAGNLTAIRFYKASQDTGTHTVAVWRSNGTLITRQTVTGESASGWQTRTLTTPVALTAGTAYVVSYTSPTGRISLTNNFWASGSYTQGPLSAARNQNGRYRYTTGAFPNSVATGTNYFVDPVFQYLGP